MYIEQLELLIFFEWFFLFPKCSVFTVHFLLVNLFFKFYSSWEVLSLYMKILCIDKVIKVLPGIRGCFDLNLLCPEESVFIFHYCLLICAFLCLFKILISRKTFFPWENSLSSKPTFVFFSVLIFVLWSEWSWKLTVAFSYFPFRSNTL